MKKKFWIQILFSLSLCLLLLGVGGLYFFKKQEQDYLQVQARAHLKNKSSLYEGIIKEDIHRLEKQKPNLKPWDLLKQIPSSRALGGEVFILNGDGRILFPKKFVADYPLSPLQNSLSKNRSTKERWFVKMNRKNKKDSILFYIKKWSSSNLFLISKQNLASASFFGSELSWLWMGVCGFFILFIFSLLFLIIQPLFTAYESLKSAFIYLGKTGSIPSWLDSSKNPFLHFYKNWSFLIKKRNSAEENSSEIVRNKTFQDVAEEEILKIQEKYPGVSVGWHIRSDVKLWGFSHFMKRILHELFLNSAEAMGGSQKQPLSVSAWEEEDQFLFSIQDQGCGVSDEDLKKVFNLYYSTKSQLGVGLNVAQSLISSHGGRLELFPLHKGKGMEARVSLPLKCFLQMHFREIEDGDSDSEINNRDQIEKLQTGDSRKSYENPFL